MTIRGLGNRIKCNPAIKTAADRAALLQALQEGRLDIIATDHAPHTSEEKASTDYLEAPAGLPLVQDALLSVFELYHDGLLSLEEIVTKTAHNVATPVSRPGTRLSCAKVTGRTW